MDKKERKILHRELETYEDMGVTLYLNGRSTTPKRIEKAYKMAVICGITFKMKMESFRPFPLIW